MWEVILPIAANIIQGALGQGIASNQAARENQRQAQMARLRRQELQPIIDKLREARNYFGVEETLVRDFTRASDQMAAQSAQTGMTNAGSGGLDHVRSDLLGGLISGLAQYKAQEEMQREQMLASLLSDPSLYAGEVGSDNPAMAGLWGALGGAAAGAGSALNSFLATDEGIAALRSVFGGNSGTLTVEDPGQQYQADAFFNLLMSGLGNSATPASTYQPRVGGGAYY